MSGGTDKNPTGATKRPALTETALDAGKVMLSAAASGARTGAKLAVGTFFAGCNLLLDVGAQAVRRLPLGEGGESAQAHDYNTVMPVPPLGWWRENGTAPEVGDDALRQAILHVNRPIVIVGYRGRIAVARGGTTRLGPRETGEEHDLPVLAMLPALPPSRLGDASFRADYGLTYAYLAGAMANGIGSEEIVESMCRMGCLGFFGAAGLPIDRVAQAVDRIQRNLGERPYGFNLIHSPHEPVMENAVVDLYLRRGVRLVDASAYLDLTLPLVRYRVKGIHREADGRIVCPNRVIAKVSRAEVARKFFAPPPEALLATLVKAGELNEEQATWAAHVPIATDMTVEADSGGHTDNRPSLTLIPGMIALRDEMQARYDDTVRLRIGAAGGIATPASAAAVFAMGAAYVMTGSINQACREAGTSQAVREMLAQAGPADVMMAPAADMFEMGVKVQVLKWGTLFGVRARKLYDLYRAHDRLEDISAKDRAVLERDFYRCTLEEAWRETRKFFEGRDPRQIARAESDPKHQMALVFRSYLGRSSDWANRGDPTRKADYQIWCGPAMGAFNEWARDSFLEAPTHRSVVTMARNLLLGAAVQTRVNWLRAQGIDVPPAIAQFRPMTDDDMAAVLQD
jgi:trans-AT polyketide synthase/acyltransferase/oxidoreductase domain-containing protein